MTEKSERQTRQDKIDKRMNLLLIGAYVGIFIVAILELF